jgi:hypothetical protein
MVTFDPRPTASMDVWTDRASARSCVIDVFGNDHCTVILRAHGAHLFSRTCASFGSAMMLAEALRSQASPAAAQPHAA